MTLSEQAFTDLYGMPPFIPAAGEALSVYMNDACAVCRTEMEHYESMSAEAACPVAFERMGYLSFGNPAYGPSDADPRRRLYIHDARGEMFSGIDAFAMLWTALPRYRSASRLIRLPLIHGICELIYDGLCVPALAAWNRQHPASERS